MGVVGIPLGDLDAGLVYLWVPKGAYGYDNSNLQRRQ